MKISVLLGAGFSKWAANLPLGNELFDYAIKLYTKSETTKLQILKGIKCKWDSQNPDRNVEEFIGYALLLDKQERDIVIWYIVRKLSDSFVWFGSTGRKYTYMIDEHVRSTHAGIAKSIMFFDFVKSLRSIDVEINGIITTNYDLLIEYALTSTGFNYGIENQQFLGRGSAPNALWVKRIRTGVGRVELTGNIRLAKIHGSLNNLMFTDSRNGLRGNALIVPPVHEKKHPSIFEHQWKLASSILEPSDKLIVFGFGFNNYDEEVINFLRDTGKSLKSIYIIDIINKTKNIAKLWPHCNIEFVKPPNSSEFNFWASSFTKIVK